MSPSHELAPLNRAEQDQLAVCEAVVDEGLRTFVEVGTALATIRDEKLYRQTHNTFAEYAHDRFGLGKAYAHRMIGAAAVKLSPIGDKITNEAQARELVPLLDDPDRLREVVAKAEASGKITAASLRAARDDDYQPHRLESRIAAALAATHGWSHIDKAIADGIVPYLQTMHWTSRAVIQLSELLRQALAACPDADLADTWQPFLDDEPAPFDRELRWVAEQMQSEPKPDEVAARLSEQCWKFSAQLAAYLPSEVADRASELTAQMLNLTALWINAVEVGADAVGSDEPREVVGWMRANVGALDDLAAAMARLGGAS